MYVCIYSGSINVSLIHIRTSLHLCLTAGILCGSLTNLKTHILLSIAIILRKHDATDFYKNTLIINNLFQYQQMHSSATMYCTPN